MMSTVDRNTPSITSHDARSLPVRQIAYLCNVAGGTVKPLITRLRHDVIGQPVEQRDPRLADAPKPNLATVYGLTGQSVKVDSVDAGVRITLAGLAGETLQHWDERGNHWRTTYDNQLRVLTLEEHGQGLVDANIYADVSADPAHNLRGQLIKQVDPSGELEIKSFSLHGQPLRDSRILSEAGTFTSSRTYSPLGAVLTQTDAGEHQQRMRYDISGQLRQVHLRLEPTAAWTPVLEDTRYNAAGQIIEQKASNQVVSTWTYDEADGRLNSMSAGVPGQDPLQFFEYLYDRVGNVLRIDDLAFKPVFFKNQLIDGHREFTYNSLYELTSATGHDAVPSPDLSGRPSPSDPKNHLNYKQFYMYDDGNNLIKLTHQRAVGGYTHQMYIDPNSNRGVRWKPGDPPPEFDKLFDRHGNLLASAPGRPLHWNIRDQLASATLVERDERPNDVEDFRYSQGVRVFKRHEWQASTLTHFHRVLYLPGLEIRTRDNGEELHVITVPGGRGSVRCLHWVSGKPEAIDKDQLRYSLDDHLGSSVMELDQDARIVSHEGYYPFGDTAWLTARSALEVSYKTIRYSGKEMDECGLCYYGSRYYAPWLWRWVSADPAGAVDGLNLYAFVKNNPTNYFDDDGQQRTPDELKAVIDRYSNLLTAVEPRLDKSIYQFNNLNRTRDIYKSSGKRAALTLVNVLASAMIAGLVGGLATTAGTFVTGGNVVAGAAIGIGGAALAADVSGNAIDSVGQKNAFGYSLLPKGDDYDLGNIEEDAKPVRIRTEIKKILGKYSPLQTDGNKETLMAGAIGTADTLTQQSTHLEKFLAFFRLSIEMTEALNDTLGPRDLELVEQGVYLLSDFLNTEKEKSDSALEELESLGGKHIALAAGTRHRLEKTETVIKGKMQRVVDLRPRATEHLQRKKAA
ncbi:RHS repeat domain-containing protein [Pseudomonas umsongensis]|uniref:RHS repeat domain-containing protein n=1 Tax=Pseudomonas umsongensis TaxID=198618 RepID=UPI00035C5806|nr:RHS repeat-associated core domain-containing protein [Pseudomonas umsongensis]